MERRKASPRPRVIDIRFREGAERTRQWSTVRLESRTGDIIRKIKKREHKRIGVLLDDMLTLYVQTKYPGAAVWCESNEK
jgi:hypothetical protein